MTSRRVTGVVAGLLLLAGCWQFGQGVYIHAKAILAQYLLQSAWEDTLAGEHRVKPWSWADTWPVARLKVNRLGIDQIVLAGATGRTLAFGPGHLDGTKKPGESGLSVISAHRDTHFRFLKELVVGDVVELQTKDGRIYKYLIKQTKVVDSRKAVLPDSRTDSLLALATCYPFDTVVPGGPFRYVVIAEDKNVEHVAYAP